MAQARMPDVAIAGLIHEHSYPILGGAKGDFDPLIEMIGDRSIVLLGESTHGTHQFYAARAEITRRLIEEKGFAAVAIEANLPDAQAIDSFINGVKQTGVANPIDALANFRRFPMWMWRNSAFLEFLSWIWTHNRRENTVTRTRLFGIDLFSLYESIDEVIRFLEKVDKQAADEMRRIYSCFDHCGRDPSQYGRHVRIGSRRSCEDMAVQAAALLLRSELESRVVESSLDSEHLFIAKIHAELVKNAESYYRNLFSPIVNTWNVRDRHMADAVDLWLEHFETRNDPRKIVIWAHNSHVGDERSTEMGWHGQINLGQLLRERHPNDTFHVGFTTFEGTVTAAEGWDQPPALKVVLPALPGSFECLLHRTGLDAFILPMAIPPIHEALMTPRLSRAIGVVYSPETERVSHYFQTRLSEQFDAIVHFDQTYEVEPLDRLTPDEIGSPLEVQI